MSKNCLVWLTTFATFNKWCERKQWLQQKVYEWLLFSCGNFSALLKIRWWLMTAGAVMDVPVIMGVCIHALIGTTQVGRLIHLTHLVPFWQFCAVIFMASSTLFLLFGLPSTRIRWKPSPKTYLSKNALQSEDFWKRSLLAYLYENDDFRIRWRHTSCKGLRMLRKGCYSVYLIVFTLF